MHSYQHHIGDFNNATRHLDRLERSIYRDLIELYYSTESPLSLDVALLCRKIIARSEQEATAVQQVLNEFFTETEHGWEHNRCEHEIEKYRSNTTAKAMAGKASAEAKKQKRLAKPTKPSTPVEQTSNECATEHEQNSTNHKPETSTINQVLNNIVPQAAQPATPTKKRITGTRLPDDWRPGQEHVDAAMELNPDYTKEWFRATAHKFKDYWISKSGKDATKTNWLATWRNWVRNDLEFNRGKQHANTAKQLDNDSTEWVDRVFGAPAGGDTGEQDFSFLEGDFSRVVIGDQGSGLLEPGQDGMAQGAD